jgi:hypothetical protein
MNNWIPDRKVTAAAAIGTPLSTLVVWGIKAAGVEVPAEVATAFTALFTALIAWLVPRGPDPYKSQNVQPSDSPRK